jgi:hypothetical protein
MAKANEIKNNIVNIVEEMDINPTTEASDSPETSEASPTIIRQGRNWQSTAVISLAIFLAIATGGVFFAFEKLSAVHEQLDTTMSRVEQKLQQLDAGISFDSKRRHLILGIRDEIMRTNPRVGLSEAYDYALWIQEASEKYPSVDPLLFVAIGTVESAYNTQATSHANAKGLYQIWPSTGRLLARTLDWEYSEEMLYDPEKNTEMAALYLDILISTYDDTEMVLAEYNGGPLNAAYIRADSSLVARETVEYVSKVKDLLNRLEIRFERGIDVRLDPMHQDSGRNGKLLGGPSQSPRTPPDSAEAASPPLDR